MNENELGTIILECAFDIHRKLGPGLLESVYEAVLARSLEKRGLNVQKQISIPFTFDGETFDQGFRADLIVEGKVIIELKSVEKLSPASKKQLLTYLKLTNLKLGYVLNFGADLMKNGITRTINGSL